MNQVELINSQEVLGKEFNVYGIQGEPLFLAKDVAEWIEYDINQVGKMLRTVDDEEKIQINTRKIFTSKGNPMRWFLTEDGVYEVLMQSTKPIAKKFKKKIKEILKDVRKYGIYLNDDFAKAIIDNPLEAREEMSRYYNESQRLQRLLEKYEGIEEELIKTEEKLQYLQERPENTDWKTEANKRVRALAPKMSSVFKPNYGMVWNKLYQEMLYSFNLNIKSKHTRRLRIMKNNNVPKTTIEQTNIIDTIGTDIEYVDIMFKALDNLEDNQRREREKEREYKVNNAFGGMEP